jgi:4-hydroxy-tetrahydrodipicolinate synthase
MTFPISLPTGSMVALVTPFHNGRIDTDAFAHLCARQIRRGTQALVVCGSTGEAPALAHQEQAKLFRIAVTVAARRVPVIAGCNGPSTEAAVAVAEHAAQCGVSALLCAPTPYVKPSQEGIMAHIRALARASTLPLVLYDVPSRTGVAISDDTIAILFERGLVAAIKDATADLSRPARLRSLCGADFIQLSGDDATAAMYRAAGGHGCISVTANITPALCARLHNSWDDGDLSLFTRTREILAPLHDALFLESNPVPVKAALEALCLSSTDVRLPLLHAKEATRLRLHDVMAPIMTLEEAVAGETLEASPH